MGAGEGKPWLLARGAAWVAGAPAAWLLGGAAALLGAPSLAAGLAVDDEVHRAKVLAGDLDLFRFMDGLAAHTHPLLDRGVAPWWTHPEVRLAFFRPVASASLALDHRALGGATWAMHAESLALFAACALLVLAFFRRWLEGPGAACLAALLWTVDDARALPVAWLANRNALLAVLFGVLAWLAHDRARRGGAPWAYVAGPAALAAALASAEAGLGAVAYLVAHAVVLDRGPRWRRALALAPYALVVGGWRALHVALGYGAAHSGYYLDPIHDAGAFLAAAPYRLLAALSGALAAPPSDAFFVVAEADRAGLRAAFVLVGLLAVGGIVAAAVRIADRALAFAALGAGLAVLPCLATLPSDRNLVFVGLGASAVVARLLLHAAAQAARGWRVLGVALVGVHLVVAPLLLVAGTLLPRIARAALDARAPFVGTELEGRTAVVVNAPAVFVAGSLLLPADAPTAPAARARVLAESDGPVVIAREGDRTLRVRAGRGHLQGRLPLLFRDAASALAPGDRVELVGVVLEVLAVDAARRVTELRATFDRPLEDPTLAWITWDRRGYSRLTLPPPGGATTLGPP